ncbi:type II secretion system F family protein [Paenibacillus cremeus]|uniref:Type II secretion system protein n=1 Tax=Paenibacillus cremeus TaxID=2163881 RepID=A0A559KDI0_9BACL|nr:type II secretion system F family protein [Paenibacillus cremeus]TVY10164.1 type II secretion system protein [Paenibacillus cremeus]
MLLLFLVELAVAAAASAVFRSRYAPWLHANKGLFVAGWGFWLPAALWFMDRVRITEHFSAAIGKVHQTMIGLHGAKAAVTQTKGYVVRLILLCYAMFCLSTLLSWAAGNDEILLYGVLLMLALPFVQFQQEAVRLKRKKQQMLMELPEVVNQLMLLVGAGETVQQALIRSISSKSHTNSSPLLAELALVVQMLQMNGSFPRVMEEFSKRCGLQEVSLFTTTLLLNYRRGGDELMLSLKELSITLWDKRKALARTLGEEASSKMVFPMVMIFFVVMVMVAAPAIMMMN